MALKITKRGRLPDRTLAGTCRNCRTEIECLPEDCEHTSDQRDGDFYTVKCPTCLQPIHPKKKPAISMAYNER
jgi:hypothetical protein